MNKKLILLLLVLAGCNKADLFDKKENQDVLKVQKLNSSIISREDIKIKYIGTSRPNYYDVVFDWPQYEGEISIKNSEKIEISNIKTENSFKINNLEGGKTVKYYFETHNLQNNIYREFEIELIPPKDLVISGTLELTEDLTLVSNRLFILDNSELHNNEHALKINFNQLFIGKNTLISPYSINLRAGADQQGRSSGDIMIHGNEAFGNLNLIMNSEGGGDGSVGPVSCFRGWVDRKCEGRDGKNSGNIGNAIIEIKNIKELELKLNILRANGGVAGQKYVGNMNGVCLDKSPEIPYNVCTKTPINGLASRNGKICKSAGEGNGVYECIE